MKEKDNKKVTRQKKGGVKKVTGEASNGNSTNGKLPVREPTPEKQIAKKEKENDVICIIGMHRSGTSLVTQLLNLCGLDIGPSDQLIPANENNPGGHFENLNFTYKVNDSLLQHFGGSWDHPPGLREGWEYDSSIAPIVEKARELIRSFSKSKHWGWKDPRTTLLLPFWKSLIPNLRFVICVRSPLEVAKSLAKRDRMPISSGVHLWQQYMRAAIEGTEDSVRSFVFYEDLFNNATSETARLLDFCGLKKPRNLSNVLDVISPALRHHTNETVELLDEHELLPEGKLLYIGLRALTTQGFAPLASGDNQESSISKNISKFYTSLQQFHEEEIVPPLQSALANKEQQLRKIAESIERDKQTHEQQEERLGKLVAQHETLKIELGNLQTLLNDKESLVTDLTTEQKRLTGEGDTLKAQVELQQKKIAEKDENIERLNIQEKRLTQETQGLQSKIQTQEEILKKKEKQVAHSTVEQGKLTQEVETLQSTIQMQQQALNEKEEEVAGLKAEKVQLARDAKSLRSKVQAQQRQLNEKEEQVAKLTAKQQQMVDEAETLRSMVQTQEQTLNKQLKDQEVQFAQQEEDLQQALNEKEEQIDLLRTSEHARQKELVEKELLLGRLISRQEEVSEEFRGLQNSILAKNNRVKFLLGQLKTLNEKLKDFKCAFGEKAELVKRLETTIEKQEQILVKSEHQLSELTDGRVRLVHEAAEFQDIVQSQQQALMEQEQNAEKLAAEVDSKKHAILEKDQLINRMTVEKSQLTQALSTIDKSLGWKIITKTHAFEAKLLPRGTRRRALYQMFWNSIKMILFQGLSHFIGEARKNRKVRKELRLKRSTSSPSATPISIEMTNEIQTQKSRILVIDRWVPTYDQDSGSLRMYSILGILAEMGHQVTFFPDDLKETEPYSTDLRQMGIEIFGGNINIEEYLRENGHVFNSVLLSRAEQAFKYIPLIRAYAINSCVIYDTVDLQWVRLERAASVNGNSDLLEESRHSKSMELFNANSSDMTLAITEEEKQTLLEQNPELKIEVVPNIHCVSRIEGPLEKRKDIMFIGGFYHQPNQDAVFYFIEEVFPIIKKKISGIRFFIVGSNPTDEMLKLNSEDIIVTGYVKDVEPYFANNRVFVSPLRYGAGMKGKIGQSMAYGLPVVTTNIGAEGIGLVDGENALIADEPAEFAEAVIRLYTDKSIWKKISTQSLTLIDKNYSKEVISKQLANIFRSLQRQPSKKEDSAADTHIEYAA